MNIRDEFKASVLNLKENDPQFEPLALEIFQYQTKENTIYRAFLENLGISHSKITHLEKIPCLPISFFKKHTIISGNAEIQHVFESSGTTGSTTSRHLISDLPFYETISIRSFEKAYGPLTDYHILALLPGYLERQNSSLIYMIKGFMYNSFSEYSGFYLNNLEELIQKLKQLLTSPSNTRKVLLVGVTFALMDLAEKLTTENLDWLQSEKLVIMETGGMKGRKKELLRDEVHGFLKTSFGSSQIHSEYGMTELLSQAYAPAEGLFKPSVSMRVLIRELNDPFTYLPGFSLGAPGIQKPHHRKTGGINVIDLANIDSCCFIETQDLGSYSEDYKHFNVLGRFDNSDLRGCNLMMVN